MTVLTKQSISVKRMPLITESLFDEDSIEMQPTDTRKHGLLSVTCMIVAVFILILMGAVTAMQIYMQLTSENVPSLRFKGYCSVPLLRDLQSTSESRKMPLRWKTSPNVDQVEPNIQVVSLMEEDPDHLFDLLREVLDIDIDESVEKISVFNNGHPVSFIHDFESNLTGIVDEERCYTMELDPEVVLQPELFLQGLQRGEEFDVRRARTELRAVLPPLHQHVLPAAFSKCADKPVYQLEKDTAVIIRKRSADAPPHDYMQFAGKRVQEIEISNLAELLEYEQENKLKA